MTERLTQIRNHCGSSTEWVVDIKKGLSYIQPDGSTGSVYGFSSKKEAEAAEALYLAKQAGPILGVETSAEGKTCGDCDIQPRCGTVDHTDSHPGCTSFKSKDKIRKFDTGATRDTAEGKLDYRKALSPIVLQRYVQYLGAHRKQPDGSVRDFDNWKKGIPTEAYFEGLGRHDMAVWLLHDGFLAEDNHGPVNLEDTLCAIIFNASGWLHEILKKKNTNPDSTKPVAGGY